MEYIHDLMKREVRLDFFFCSESYIIGCVVMYPKITPTIWKTEQKTDFRSKNHHYLDKFCQVIDLYNHLE